jgi:PAS domain S-box-containing protein
MVPRPQDFIDIEKAEARRSREGDGRLAGELAALAEIGRVIGSAPDIEQVYDRFAAITRRLIPFDTLSVNLIDTAQGLFRIAHFSGIDLPGRKVGDAVPIAGSMTGYVLDRRKGMIFAASTPEESARLYPQFTQIVSIQAGFRSNMLVPLFANDAMIGVLHFRAKEEAAYGEADLRLAERVGMQIAGAIANAQLFANLRRTEKALRESEERFRLAYATSPDAMSINRLGDGLYEDINEGFTRLTGYTREEVLGRTVRELGIWADPADQQTLLEGLTKNTYVENLEAQFRRKDGSTATALMSAKILVLQGVPHVLSISRDISDRKRAAEERARLQAQLLQAQKMESVGRLAGGVAHDFNNMLGVILGHLEMAMDKIGPDTPLHADLRQIEKAARRSADLTGQLLAFARKQTISPKVLDLNEAVEEALKMLRRLIGEDITLAWMPGGNLWPVRMDPSQLDQILANLCVNARDAITGMGKLTIETENVAFDATASADHNDALPGDYVLLAVSDDGCGMDSETLGKLFEPFFTTKGLGKGTGLGLATLYGIVRQNDGFVTVESEPGRGSTFRIHLPRHAGRIEAPRPAPAPAEALQGRETILVVEDERDLLDLTRLMLERQGYRVLAAGTPGEAIRLAAAHRGEIHLLMTDVVMPEMNGRELAKRIIALYPDIECLFTSGYTADVIAHHGVLDRGTFFIQKPFSRNSLAAKVRELLDRG